MSLNNRNADRLYMSGPSRNCVGLLLVMAVLMLAGCAESHKVSTAKDTDAATKKSGNPPTEPAAALDITVVDKAGYEKAIAGHRGKVVLVDYWATWCSPCVKQFPHTVELWHKYRDRGLDAVALSLDDPENIDEVRTFLLDKGATFENLISKVGSSPSAADEFDFDGALPHYVLYDREGKLVKRLSPSDPTIKFRLDMVDAAVEELLGTPTP